MGIHTLVAGGPETRERVVALLEASGGYTVVAEAENGVRAVQLAEHHQPDLVVIEAELPELGGIEATAPIRSRVPDSTIVVLTRQAGGRLAMRAGADGCVPVESDDAAIVAAVQDALPLDLRGHSSASAVHGG
jgi:DNA-binding NarL/FixJ family response regulator